MTKIYWFLILILSLGLHTNCYSQIYEEPPGMSMPADENKLLIKEIIEITDYKSYFDKYCLNYISKVAKEEKWSKEKIKKANESISFWGFDITINNWLSGYTNKQLKEYLELYKKDKKSHRKSILIENPDIQRALKSKAMSIITELQK